MLSEETEEDIYDFSGVSYDLTALRSELMHLGGKRKTRSSDESDYEISDKNGKKYDPLLSSGFSSSKNETDMQPPKLPPKEKGVTEICWHTINNPLCTKVLRKVEQPKESI